MWWAWPSLELDEIQIWYRLTLLFCPFCQMIKGQRNQREYKKWTKYNNFHILFSTKTLLILNMITITACFHNFFFTNSSYQNRNCWLMPPVSCWLHTHGLCCQCTVLPSATRAAAASHGTSLVCMHGPLIAGAIKAYYLTAT